MQRSQVMLLEEQHRFLADESRRAGKSMSALIREWIEERMQAQWDTPLEQDSLWKMVGIARGGPGCASEEHDRLLASARLKRRPRGRRRRS